MARRPDWSAQALRARVLLSTSSLVVADKPAGLETVVRGGGNTRYCFTSRLRRALGAGLLAPAHRLDRDTTGCVALARNEQALEPLEAAFREREVGKQYLGLCLGPAPDKRRGTVRERLSRWRPGRRPVQPTQGRGGQAAETAYRVLGAGAAQGLEASLVLFEPRTGRTHQVRVHAAVLGRPLCGDHEYGDRAANRALRAACGLRRQALHAWRLVFPDPDDGTRRQVEAPVPGDLAAAADLFVPDWAALLARL